MMADRKIKVGFVGVGTISGAYFRGCSFYDVLEVVACADLDVSRAQARADENGVPKACDVETLLADPEIDIVLNLTIPKVHAEVALAAVAAGKSTYSEKPFALTREEGSPILQLAKEKGVLVGCAPDTFLGGGIQTCRKLIDDGWIGRPIGASAFMMSHGPEGWHPDPDFYFQPGGGPMFDMGPYYLTALVSLLGPVKRVTGSVTAATSQREVGSGPKKGQKIEVNVDTHVTGILDFENGAIGTITTSFETWAAELPRIEIYGTEGTLSVPDPNTFGGPIRFTRPGVDGWMEIPILHQSTEPGRGTGVADMAYAILNNRPVRASGELAFHVLDIMQTIHEASREGRHINLGSTCTRPEPLPLGPVERGLAL